MNDVNITVLSGGLSRRNAVSDAVSGLVVGGTAVGTLQLNTPYKLTSLDDAAALSIVAALDDAMTYFVYEHIKEFFRINVNGTLWLLVCAQTVTLPDMVLTSSGPARTLLNAANGEISQLGIFHNISTGSTTFDMSVAVPNAQALADAEFTSHKPLLVVIGGSNFDYSSIDDLTTLNSPNVAVVVGGHSSIFSNEYAMLGTVLGAISKARVNQSIAWVLNFDVSGGNVQLPTFDGSHYNSLTDTVRNELQDKGYIFPIQHIGKSGVYLNDSRTCSDIATDLAYVENVRTINKAAKLTREALLPFLNSPIDVDTDGLLSPEVVKAFESAVSKLIDEQMNRNGEVSSFDVYVDPSQNILSTSELNVNVSVVPTGTARQINVSLGFSNPF